MLPRSRHLVFNLPSFRFVGEACKAIVPVARSVGSFVRVLIIVRRELVARYSKVRILRRLAGCKIMRARQKIVLRAHATRKLNSQDGVRSGFSLRRQAMAPSLTQHDLIRPDPTQHIAGLLVEKVEIQKLV